MMKNGKVKELEAQMMVGNKRVRRLEQQVSQLKKQIQSLQKDSNKKQDALGAQMRQMTVTLWQQQQEPKMRISVINMKGKFIPVYVASKDTISIVKMKIEGIEGIPPDEQMLICLGRQLEDRMTVADYNIRDEWRIHLVVRQQLHQQGQMRVFVTNIMETRSTEVYVDSSDTIHTLKMKFELIEGISWDWSQHALLFDGKRLADVWILADHDIQHESTLDLSPTQIGC